MEKRKDTLSMLKICRFCLCQDETLASLYDTGKPKNAIPISLKILSCMSIEVFPSDKMPSFICSKCKFFVDVSYEYKQVFRHADENILQYIQKGSALKSVDWPAKLISIYPNDKKNLPRQIMKTILKDGATVQVTQQDMDDTDDDENVYDIKIGGGSDDQPKDVSATIKVVTNDQTSRNSENPDSKDSDEETSEGPPRVVKTGCFPCDECYCTYPLQQLLDLHKSQKHRARSVNCYQCDAKFFTKYDLMTHMLRHSDEMPFQCVACGRKFKRLVLLKRHEKFMHSDIPQLPCANCPATFLSIEEVTAHQKKHVKSHHKNLSCTYCPKRFHEKSTLQRHIDVIHHNKPGFRCEYCPEQFSSVSKLTRHVRTHASPRGYPCKYCDKSFLKSHHYTRHLRVKHREATHSARGPFGQSESYRCEQCEDCFSTQDELIYHSAIHATQNLTCPLCQEKFENVDDVTSHIKSHVNGVEFMCDFCELVFTARAKLDAHLASAHNEEIDTPLPADESSMDMDDEDDDEDDNAINVKEEDDHMVVEIKKPADFIVKNNEPDTEEKHNTNSEDSDAEATYTDLATVDTLSLVNRAIAPLAVAEKSPPRPAVKTPAVKTEKTGEPNQTASILRKAEEIKRKVQQKAAETSKVTEKGKTNNKPESTNSAGASDKSLRLLEKELQELQRTNTRNEAAKAATKTVDSLRSRRPQVHTSTPKTRAAEEKKAQAATKSPAVEKKLPERRVVTKENKEPKEKETKTNNTSSKEEKEKESKEKETPKNAVKNGGATPAVEKSTAEESIRRSTRPSKIKDYAKMVRDKAQDSDDDESDMDDEEYDVEESRPKPTRRSTAKPAPKATSAPASTPSRKRGRPRKEPLKEVPNKMKKDDTAENEEAKSDKEEEAEENTPKPAAEPVKPEEPAAPKECVPESNVDNNKPNSDVEPKPASGVLVSPTGQTLKKVPIRALPPGVKPLPLPMNARPMGPGELCEMQIGKKVVKVQKIVMTKAEVEEMAKKGLVEMKDGNMVLKQGIKLPTSDPVAIKSSLVGDKDMAKESPTKNAQEKEATNLPTT